jgi:uncharacterized protein (TIGR03435 family)
MTERGVSNSQRILPLNVSWVLFALVILRGPLCAAQNVSGLRVLHTEKKLSAFDVISIRPHGEKNDGNAWNFKYTTDGVSAPGITLRRFIQRAYGIMEDDRLSGLPGWADSTRYDIQAKVDSSNVSDFQNLTLDERRHMLQSLLAERFKLVAHHENKELPIYALVIAKSGFKLQKSKSSSFSPVKGIDCLVTASKPASLKAEYCSMQSLATQLTREVDRPVVDRTGLSGYFDIDLQWTPDTDPAAGGGLLPEPPGPSIFSAVQKQLGLSLNSSKGALDTIVIDHLEQPSPN